MLQDLLVQNKRTERGRRVAQVGLRFHKMFKVSIGLQNSGYFLKLLGLAWQTTGFSKVIFWPIRHLYLLSLHSRSENNTISCTHTGNQTVPKRHVQSWTCKAVSLTADHVSLNDSIPFSVSQTQYPEVISTPPSTSIQFQSVSNYCSIISTMPLLSASLLAIHAPSDLNSILHHFSFGLLLQSLQWPPGLECLPSPINTIYVARITFPKYKSHHVSSLVKH